MTSRELGSGRGRRDSVPDWDAFLPDRAPTAPSVLVVLVAQLDVEFASHDGARWMAGLPPKAMQTAKWTPRSQELDDAGRLFPTAIAAVRTYRANEGRS